MAWIEQVVPQNFHGYAEIKAICTRVVSHKNESNLVQFEPDMLGETYFLLLLEALNEEFSYELRESFYSMLSIGSEKNEKQDAIEFIAFIERLARNLSHDQEDEYAETYWELILDFLTTPREGELKPWFEGSLMAWAASIVLINLFEFRKDSDSDYAKRCLEQVNPEILFSQPFLVSKSLEAAMIYFCHSTTVSESFRESFLAYSRLFDLVQKNIHGSTVLMLSCFGGRLEVAEFLLKNGASVNLPDNNGMTALMFASNQGYPKTVKLLLNCHDIDVNAQDNNKRTVLMDSCSKGYGEIVSALLTRPDLNINAKDKDKRTALMYACAKLQSGYVNRIEVVRSLLKRSDLEVNARDLEQGTTLMYACDLGDTEIVKALIERSDLDINAKNDMSLTALIDASYQGNNDVVKIFLARHDLDVNACDIGEWTSLMHACQHSHLNVLKSLLERPLI